MPDSGSPGRDVLIIEDNRQNLELAQFLLEEAGHVVRSAGDAKSARAEMERQVPDLVLMDMQLPGFDGMAVTQELRSQPRARPLAIVAFTAYAMMGDREKFLAAGCDGYIAKPVNVATFADEVRALLPHAPA